jgi:hypothetical protein
MPPQVIGGVVFESLSLHRIHSSLGYLTPDEGGFAIAKGEIFEVRHRLCVSGNKVVVIVILLNTHCITRKSISWLIAKVISRRLDKSFSPFA